MPHPEPHNADSVDRNSMRAILADLTAGLGMMALMAGATWWLLGRPTSFLAICGAIYLGLAALIMLGLPRTLSASGLGAANRVTLFRATLVVPVAALALEFQPLATTGYWWVIVITTVALFLDGYDGRIARSTGTETPFGARFDMELDAALILVLCVLAWASGKVGVWVLLIGLMRYGFVAASWVWPRLRGELPDSFRRKWICVAQGVALLVALGPIISPPWANAAAAAGLLLLTYSFAVDVWWLARPATRHRSPVSSADNNPLDTNA